MAYEGTLLAASITTGAAPSSDIITFPTHEDVYGKGGMMCVSTFEALTSIPVDRQKLGMMIYVADSNTYYRIHTIGAPLVGVTGSFSLSSLDLSNGLTVTGNISGNNLRTSFNQGSATGDYSFAVNRGKAFGSFSHAEGFATAFGNGSHAEGISTKAVAGFGSHSEGSNTLASGNSSHVEGLNSSATGSYSHAEGYDTVTGERIQFLTYTASTRLFTFSNSLSSKFNNFVTPGTVLRAKNIALNFYSDFIVASRDSINGAISATSDVFPGDVANGFIVSVGNIVAFGAHAEGYLTTASGNFGSHAEGANTIASGELASHAEGRFTIASGSYAHAEGDHTRARGNTTHSAGAYSEAAYDGSWIWRGFPYDSGAPETTYTYLSTTRANQFMVSAAGGAAFFGNVGIGTDSINNALTVNGDISAQTISAQLINLSASNSSSSGISFGPQFNMYLAGNQSLRVDNNFQILNRLILGYNAVTNNDGAVIEMDYSNGGDSGQLYISTRDNGNEPIIFQQRDDWQAPTFLYEPLVIGSDHHIGINVPLSARTFPEELTVYGNISATGTLHGRAQDLVLNATSTNTIANSAITSALLLLSPAPTYTPPVASLTNFTSTAVEVGTNIAQTLTLDWTQNDAGPLKSNNSFFKNNVFIGTFGSSLPQSFSPAEPAVLGTTTYLMSANYETGPIKNNVLGFPDTRGQILAGSVTDSSSYTGYYRRWIGSDSTFPTSPASIRNLGLTTTLDTNNTLASQASPIYIDSKFILIAIPNTKSLVSVITEANENLTSQFNLSSLQIPDAESTLRDYKLYYLETAVPLNANLTNVTIS